MNKRVIGKFMTRYGHCRFVMDSAKKASLFIDGTWELFSVEYSGQMSVAKLEDTQDALSLSAVNGWYIRGGETSINRVDKKDINYKSDTYNKIKDAMIRGFIDYINNPTTSGVLTIAARIKLDNEREQLVNDVTAQSRKLELAKAALEQWDRNRGPLYDALGQGVMKMNSIPGVTVLE